MENLVKEKKGSQADKSESKSQKFPLDKHIKKFEPVASPATDNDDPSKETNSSNKGQGPAGENL